MVGNYHMPRVDSSDADSFDTVQEERTRRKGTPAYSASESQALHPTENQRGKSVKMRMKPIDSVRCSSEDEGIETEATSQETTADVERRRTSTCLGSHDDEPPSPELTQNPSETVLDDFPRALPSQTPGMNHVPIDNPRRAYWRYSKMSDTIGFGGKLQKPDEKTSNSDWVMRNAQTIKDDYMISLKSRKCHILNGQLTHPVVVLQVYFLSRDGNDNDETLDHRCKMLAYECLLRLKPLINGAHNPMVARVIQTYCEADYIRHDKQLQNLMAQAISRMWNIEKFMQSSPYKELLDLGWRHGFMVPMQELLGKIVIQSTAEERYRRERRSGL